jgi:hypothetical protein
MRIFPDRLGRTDRIDPTNRARCAPGHLAATMSLLLALAAPMASSSAPRLSAQASDAADLVTKIGDRLATLPKLESWRAKAHSTTSYMTSDWKPKKTTTADKIVTVDGRLHSEEILSAVETEDGKTRDVTKKLQAEAAERAEKQKRQSAKEDKDEQRSRGRRSTDMTRDEILPFGPDKRAGYDFTVKGTAELGGAPVILLQSRSRVRSEEKLEGLYYIDPATCGVRRAELTLAKKPGPLKRMEMEFDFGILPEGHQVMTKAVMRMHVGLVVKNIRVEAVESYSDYVIPARRP